MVVTAGAWSWAVDDPGLPFLVDVPEGALGTRAAVTNSRCEVKNKALVGQQVSSTNVGVGELYTASPALTICLPVTDRKSTRLNSSHLGSSYAVFCLKKK